MAKYIDFMFVDDESGEEFFVELKDDGRNPKDLLKEAKKIAKENFEQPRFCGKYSQEEADILGYDTY